MKALTLGVLLCDSVHPDRLAVCGDYPQIFSDLFAEFSPSGFEIALRFYDVTEGHYPDNLRECHGYLTNGAGASVNDPDPWIATLAEFLRTLHAQDIPLFGICFGHQLIASALGGRVEQSTRGWGVGIHEVEVVAREPWMSPPSPSFRIACSHQDQVVDLPPGSVVLGSTPHCPVALFRCGSLVGIQGHPEFRSAYAEALLLSRRDILPRETFEPAHASFSFHPPDHALLVSWILHHLGGPPLTAADPPQTG